MVPPHPHPRGPPARAPRKSLSTNNPNWRLRTKRGATLEKYAPRRSDRYLLRFWSPFWPKKGGQNSRKREGPKSAQNATEKCHPKAPPGPQGGPKIDDFALCFRPLSHRAPQRAKWAKKTPVCLRKTRRKTHTRKNDQKSASQKRDPFT